MWTDAPPVLTALAVAVLALSLPGTLYLLALTLGSLRRPSSAPAAPEAGYQVAIIVPAHNEGRALLRTLHSLRQACAGDASARLVVIADNCSDDTATQARAVGVEVLERQDPHRRGKGYALEWAFEQVKADWYIVVDADTDVEPGFLAAMRRAMQPGCDALQCRYLVRDALQTRRGTLADIAWAAWNVLRPRGRAGWGLSAGILGNGFALSRATLDRLPYTARSIVEDVEYHILLVRAGMRVRWVDGTTVRGDMPVASGAAATQRARWEGGRLRLAIDQVPGLLRDVLLRGRIRLLDPLCDLLLLALAMHVALVAVAAVLGAWVSPMVLVAALASLLVVAVHVVVGLALIRAGRAHWSALLAVPGYIVWKLLLTARIVRSAGRSTGWVRSEREGQKGELG